MRVIGGRCVYFIRDRSKTIRLCYKARLMMLHALALGAFAPIPATPTTAPTAASAARLAIFAQKIGALLTVWWRQRCRLFTIQAR